METTHLGHACVLVETDRARLLVDPGTMSWGFESLTDLDAVLVSHEHADHVDLPGVLAVLEANPAAALVTDATTATQFGGHPQLRVAAPGDELTLGRESLSVLGGRHAPVYGDVPGCPNLAFLVGDGAFFHPGDSLLVPPGPIGRLAVPIDGPWLKLAEAVDFLKAVAPDSYLPIHEGELTDAPKYVGMLAQLSGFDTQTEESAHR